jgi:hypothetical protein
MFVAADFTVPGYQVLSVSFEELPAAAPSMGLAAVELSADENTVEFAISAFGLSGEAIGAHFHRAPVGLAGPVLIDLTSSIVENGRDLLRIEGALPTTTEFVNALRAGNVYVNIHTSLNPSGELRGQVTTLEAFHGELDTLTEVPTPVLGTDVRVAVRNAAPELGTFQTPVWIGFHDGSFDIHDLGSPASTFFPLSNALERLAEDGSTTQFTEAFQSSPSGTIQGVLPGLFLGGPISPGETISRRFRVDPDDPQARYLSYATMVIPSNDAFISNGGPQDHEVFDGAGTFVGADFTVLGAQALDAGTEVNDEVPANTAFFGQVTEDTGVDEGGVVAPHPGFLAPGMGGILDDPSFANADFTAPGYEFLNVSLDELQDPVPGTGLVVAFLDSSASLLTFAVGARDLSGEVTAMHFHEGAPGVAGPVVIDITDSIEVNTEGSLAAAGVISVTDEIVSALRAGNVYVNLHTALNPSGEVRGQVILMK